MTGKISSYFFVIFLFIASSVFGQETFTHPDAGVSITLPAGWYYEIEGDDMNAYSEDNAVAMSFSVLHASDIDAALEEVDKMIDSLFENISLGEAESFDLNGMNTIFLEGQADGLEIAFELIETPISGVSLFLSAWGTADAVEKYSSDIELIFGSISPSSNE
jgi:predicted Zn-dependent protease